MNHERQTGRQQQIGHPPILSFHPQLMWMRSRSIDFTAHRERIDSLLGLQRSLHCSTLAKTLATSCVAHLDTVARQRNHTSLQYLHFFIKLFIYDALFTRSPLSSKTYHTTRRSPVEQVLGLSSPHVPPDWKRDANRNETKNTNL